MRRGRTTAFGGVGTAGGACGALVEPQPMASEQLPTQTGYYELSG